VDVDHLVGTIEKRVGHRLAHADAGDPCNGVVQRLEVLNVHGRHDVDAGVEEFEDVLIPLLVFAAWNVGMRQFVDDDDIGTTCDDPVDVHLLHRHAAVFHLAPRNDLEVLYLRVGIGAPVGFDDADRDVQAAGFQRVRFLQHRVRLADTWRGADVDAQTRAIALLHSREQCLRVYFLIGHCSSSARLSWRTLTRGSPRNPNWRSSMWPSTRARIADSLARRDRAMRATWNRAASGVMCGSRPDADEVTRSIGTCAVGFSARAASAAAFTASISFLFVGPRFVPPEFAAS